MTSHLENSSQRSVLGICFMLLGLILYPLSDACLKHLMDSYSVYQVTFLRSLGRTIPLLVIAYLQFGIKNALTTQKPLDHAVRLVVGLLYTFSFMLALKLDTLAVIYSLSYTTPLFMIGLSVLILKEKVGYERYLAALVGMAGVVFIVNENFYSLKVTALIVLFGSFLSALKG